MDAGADEEDATAARDLARQQAHYLASRGRGDDRGSAIGGAHAMCD
jgi:hypothetical protein